MRTCFRDPVLTGRISVPSRSSALIIAASYSLSLHRIPKMQKRYLNRSIFIYFSAKTRTFFAKVPITKIDIKTYSTTLQDEQDV